MSDPSEHLAELLLELFLALLVVRDSADTMLGCDPAPFLCGQLQQTSALGAGGRQFESGHPDQ